MICENRDCPNLATAYGPDTPCKCQNDNMEKALESIKRFETSAYDETNQELIEEDLKLMIELAKRALEQPKVPDELPDFNGYAPFLYDPATGFFHADDMGGDTPEHWPRWVREDATEQGTTEEYPEYQLRQTLAEARSGVIRKQDLPRVVFALEAALAKPEGTPAAQEPAQSDKHKCDLCTDPDVLVMHKDTFAAARQSDKQEIEGLDEAIAMPYCEAAQYYELYAGAPEGSREQALFVQARNTLQTVWEAARRHAAQTSDVVERVKYLEVLHTIMENVEASASTPQQRLEMIGRITRAALTEIVKVK